MAFSPRPLSNSRTTTTLYHPGSQKIYHSTSDSTTETTTTTTSSSSSSTDKDDTTLEWTTDRVRSTFCDFFANQYDHARVASSSCVPLNDPTLLFANAGMNQFKPVFLGQVDPSSPLAQLESAVNAQKCIRAGGKHNDLEEVGVDTYHHTFFEMLGTWSFSGTYFKEQAVRMAWELLTNVYELDPNSLYATYFEGNDQVPADTEARDLWLQYLPPDRVIACCAKDNFWEMGDTGPCGPCTEIHYDRFQRPDSAAASMVNADDPNVIEIWNLVFIQYNRQSATELQPLPAKHVDTGMGLERLVSILQNVTSNYDIDVFQTLIRAVEPYSKVGPYTGRVGDDDVGYKDTAYRAIVDHVRTLSFALADGAVPSNEGRGYVLRRIVRRALRYGQQVLEAPSGFLTQLIPTVVQTFGAAYPELIPAQDTIVELVREEETSFGLLLERGIRYFEETILKQEETTDMKISGDQAFYLYDTLGFPVDLTELMATEAGWTVDTAGFETAMQEQKDRSRQAQKRAQQQRRSGATSDADGTDMDATSMELVGELQAEQTAWLQDQGIAPTDDSPKYEWNTDGSTESVATKATVQAIYQTDGTFCSEEVSAGSSIGLVLDQTPFYAEAGGQEADTGVIHLVDDDTNEPVGTMVVTDVQVYAGYVLHKGYWKGTDIDATSTASLKVSSRVSCHVDYQRRQRIAPNHSMTHVLNAALRNVLGDKVEQRGSLCNEEKLRFDFTHKKALTVPELQQVQDYCQTVVAQAETVTSQVLPLEQAQAIPGVRAVFGEVYPDPVRVISIGDDDSATSIEFCGGTHISNTREAQAFCLVEETAVAKGIRRISAVTQEAAADALAQGETMAQQVETVEAQLQQKQSDVEATVTVLRKDLDAAVISAPLKADLRERISVVQNKIQQAKKQALQQRVDIVLNELKVQVEEAVASGQSTLVTTVDIGADSKASQRVRNAVQDWAPELAFLGLSPEELVDDGKCQGKLLAFGMVPSSSPVAATLKANEWVLAALQPCNGKGGGKPDNAQGQAPECSDLDAVVEAARAFCQSQL